jgi:hypothetical protein
MRVCTYVYICIYIYIYIYAGRRISLTTTPADIHSPRYTIPALIRTSECIYKYAQMYVCVYVCIYIHTHTYIYAGRRISLTTTHADIHSPRYTSPHSRQRKFVYVCLKHISKRSFRDLSDLDDLCVCLFTHINTHTHTHTHTHTQTAYQTTLPRSLRP